MKEPDILDDDYLISDNRGGGYYVNSLDAVFMDFDCLIAAIVIHMEQEQYWPNVWQVNDHGNVDLLAIDEDKTYRIVQSWV